MGGFLSKSVVSNVVSDPKIVEAAQNASKMVEKAIDDQAASCCSSVSKFTSTIKAKIAFSNCCNNILIAEDTPRVAPAPSPPVVDVLPTIEEVVEVIPPPKSNNGGDTAI